MARPVSIKPETIIDAARQVFLERGIQATTAEVAERAGISEGTIFKRYKSKIDLFRAAMGENLVQPSWSVRLAARVGQGTVEENLFEIGMGVIAFFREMMPLMMMAWSNPSPNGLPGPLAGPNPPPMRALKLLTGFFEAEMRAGRLRKHDAEIVARTFLGGLNNFVFFEVLYKANNELPLAAETYVRGLVQLLWAGIAPGPQAR
jgi:AcrR family transcriptional regulator